ncbi:MAG: flippase-like domain-containing protein [Chitinivibrionales bacterium]|nr:flippase-like domain-containing protein [Chitinivibrionales bacterium]
MPNYLSYATSVWRGRRGGPVVRAAVSVALVVLVLARVDIRQSLEKLGEIHWTFIAAAVALQCLAWLISAFRWQVLLRHYGFAYRIPFLTVLYAATAFFSNFLPSTVGGDLYRFTVVTRGRPGTGAKALASIVLDRGVGLVSLMAMNAVVSLVLFSTVVRSNLLTVLAGAMTLGLLLLVFGYAQRARLSRLLDGWRGRPVVGRIHTFANAVGDLDNNLVAASAFVYSVVFVLLCSLLVWIFLIALGTPATFGQAVLVYTTATFAAMAPLTINGIGLLEAAYVALVYGTGGTAEVGLSLALLMRLTALGVSIPAGVFHLTAGRRGTEERS